MVRSRKRIWLSSIFALLTAVESATAVGDEYHQDFRTEPLDSKSLAVFPECRELRLEPGPAGLRIRIRPSAARDGAVRVATRFMARGDFEITLAYELLQVGPPADGHGAGIGLEIWTDSAESASASIERLVCPGEKNVVRVGRITTVRWGERTREYSEFPASGQAGRLRIAREGSLMRVSCSDGDDEFRALSRYEAARTDLEIIRLACTAGRSTCGVDLLVTDFRVCTANLVELPDRFNRPSILPTRNLRPWRVGLLAISGAAFIACVGFSARSLALRRPQLESGKPGRHGWTAVVAGGIAVMSLSMANHLRAVQEVGYHIDETIWTTRSYFYRLAIFDRNFRHALWQADADGLDAPHVNDILIGASLHLTGQPLPPVPEHSNSWPLNRPPEGDHLLAARAPSALLGSLVAPLVYLIGLIACRRLLAGLAAGGLYACHPVVLLCQSRAMLEGPLMFFSSLSILILAWGLVGDESAEKPIFSRRRITLLLVGPLCLGLTIGVKLTGIFIAAAVGECLALYAALDLAQFKNLRSRIWPWIAYLGLFLGFSVAAVISFNPTLYSHPFARFRAMIELREAIAEFQAEILPQWVLHGPMDQALAAAAHVGAPV